MGGRAPGSRTGRGGPCSHRDRRRRSLSPRGQGPRTRPGHSQLRDRPAALTAQAPPGSPKFSRALRVSGPAAQLLSYSATGGCGRPGVSLGGRRQRLRLGSTGAELSLEGGELAVDRGVISHLVELLLDVVAAAPDVFEDA